MTSEVRDRGHLMSRDSTRLAKAAFDELRVLLTHQRLPHEPEDQNENEIRHNRLRFVTSNTLVFAKLYLNDVQTAGVESTPPSRAWTRLFYNPLVRGIRRSM